MSMKIIIIFFTVRYPFAQLAGAVEYTVYIFAAG